MSEPDRPAPIDPSDDSWPEQDPEATQVVRRPPPGPTGGDDAPASDQPSGPAADAEPTATMPPYGGAEPPTSYIGAPTASYPGPDATGAQPSPPLGYSYQQDPGYLGGATGPQVIPPPPTTNVVLPPVRMPKAESRVALNILGTIVGLLLVAGGLVLLLIYQPQMRTLPASNTGNLPNTPGVGIAAGGSLDVLALVLTIVGAVLIALAALLAAWASWAPIVPGVLLTAASVWAMVTTGAGSGGVRIADGTRWVFKDGQLALLCMNGLGLAIGLVLLFCGLAAVFLRAGVRRTIRQQLESIQY